MADKDYLDKNGTSYLWNKAKQKIDAAKTTVDAYTINGKKVSNNPTLGASDVGAAPLVGGKIPAQYIPTAMDDVVYIMNYASGVITEDELESAEEGRLTTLPEGWSVGEHVYYDSTLQVFYIYAWSEDTESIYFQWDKIGDLAPSDNYGDNKAISVVGKNIIAKTKSPNVIYRNVSLDTIAYEGTGEEGKVYVDTISNKTYRWGGSSFVIIGTDLALGETAETAFRGDHGAWIYNSIMQGNPAVVTPVITISWTYYKYTDTSDATSVTPEKNAGSTTSPQIEIGYRAKYTASWKWTTESGKKNPTATSGTFGTTLPSSGVASASKTTTVTATTTISQTVTAPKQGLVVSNNAVVAPSGTDSASASHKITFLYKRYWGVTTATTITESIIEGLKDSELTSSKSKTITGVTAQKGEYYVIAYPTALGELSGIIQNGATPVLDAFTRTTVSVTNAAGYTQNYYVYRTINDGAFTSAKLALS
jgi:hypothetical protein